MSRYQYGLRDIFLQRSSHGFIRQLFDAKADKYAPALYNRSFIKQNAAGSETSRSTTAETAPSPGSTT